jgi:predicted RNA polymerase sigma factor
MKPMQYLPMIYVDEAEAAKIPPEAIAQMMPAHAAYNRAMAEAAVIRGGELDPRSVGYQPYRSSRAEIAAAAGDVTGALESFDRAIGLEQDAAVRRFLLQRRDALAAGT